MSYHHKLIESTYAPDDVTFLLKPVEIAPTPVVEKEVLIQSGRAHYSEMISSERRPDARYMEIFEAAWSAGKGRIAREIMSLAEMIRLRVSDGEIDSPVTLCSLVRAGVPYGVLLLRALRHLGVEVAHFGISIIRDRGLDANAIAWILRDRPAGGVIFVDGWTGKGTISNELSASWSAISGGRRAELAVLADPSGFATMSGSHEDWLIPSGILGANVSGLISRSILNRHVVGPRDFHGAIPAAHLKDIDVSMAFVDSIWNEARALDPSRIALPVAADRSLLRKSALDAVHAIAAVHGVDNLNRIKPGIAEATRAVLRRKPKQVFLRDIEDPDLSALVHLCRTDGVGICVDSAKTGPYRAVTLIEKVG